MTTLRSTSDIITALGGIEAVAELTGTSINGVYNWRAGKQFPADTYLLLNAALKAIGDDAPDTLWPMRQAPKKAAKGNASAVRLLRRLAAQ
jgi:hypothetical protein